MELPSSLLLEQFLIEERALNLPKTDAPNISIIIVLYNRVDLTLQCIQSVIAQPYDNYEVIVVDNGSTDQTGYVLKRLCGNANVIYNSENRGFLDACNQGAEKARGQKLLFLNNDTIVLGNSIGLAAEILESSDDIGAVGGRLILPDGTLQEAGSFVEKNGSCEVMVGGITQAISSICSNATQTTAQEHSCSPERTYLISLMASTQPTNLRTMKK